MTKFYKINLKKLYSVGDCSTKRLASTRLLNGQKATEGDFQIVITYQNKFKCSGSRPAYLRLSLELLINLKQMLNFLEGVIIDSNWALTAAHCVQGLKHFIKIFKDTKRGLGAAGDQIPIELIQRHHNWNRRSQWDIAIIKFAKPVESGNFFLRNFLL